MTAPFGRMSSARLVRLLGAWRARGARQGSAGLAAGIRLLVLDGQLPPGTGLPAERELAAALGVSRTLVGAAWDVLRAEGLITSRRGSGTWTTLPSRPGRPGEPPNTEAIDLARAAPDAPPGVAQAFDAVRCRFGVELRGHGYHELGLPELRERIAERFTARGVPTGPEHILVTNGAHHALALVLRALAGPGDRVLVEQPTYPNAIDAIRAAHAVPVAVPLPEEGGWDLDGVEAALRQAAPRLVYAIVDFQNPTGHRLDAEGRARLAALARRARTPLVVDETQVELDFGDPADAPPAMAAVDGGSVITVGSASKSHWGGLRVGWVRAHEETIGALAAARHAFDLGSPVYEQLVLAELYRDPLPLLADRVTDLAGRRDALVAALREHCPDWTFTVPSGGLALWCGLPGPMSTRLAVSAQNHGVRIVPGSRFGVHGGLERRLRLPYTLPAPRLVEAVRRLAVAAAAVAGSSEGLRPDGLVPVA